MKKFVRKLRKVSTHSYALIIPKELVKKFRWKERQKLEIIFGGRLPKIVIKDWDLARSQIKSQTSNLKK